MLRRLVPVLSAVALLSACAVLVPPPEQPVARPLRNDISRFSLSGRVAVRNGEESLSANIEWRHGGDGTDRILLTSPLGQGLAELNADAAGAHLETADRQSFSAADLEGLSEQVFGAALPLSSLPRWVVGQVWNAVEALQIDGRGRPQSFLDRGWRVAYLHYEADTADALPTFIQLRRDDLDVKLRIDQWNLAP